MLKICSGLKKVFSRNGREVLRNLANRRYEVDDSGLLMPGDFRIGWEGKGFVRVNGEFAGEFTNSGTIEGWNYILEAAIRGGTAYSSWYTGPFSGNVTPGTSLTAATFHSTCTELSTAYAEAARPAYTTVAAASASVTNSAAAATITVASGQSNVLVRGAGILSVSTKQSTSGKLLSAWRLTADITLPAEGNTLDIVQRITLANVA